MAHHHHYHQAVTSSVTEISHDPSLPEGQFLVSQDACSPEEWEEQKRFLVEILAGSMTDTGGLAEEEMQEVARQVLSAACPEVALEDVRADSQECEAFAVRGGHV